MFLDELLELRLFVVDDADAGLACVLVLADPSLKPRFGRDDAAVSWMRCLSFCGLLGSDSEPGSGMAVDVFDFLLFGGIV